MTFSFDNFRSKVFMGANEGHRSSGSRLGNKLWKSAGRKPRFSSWFPRFLVFLRKEP
ncbi:hypothetical protein A2U01_0084118, partial [Trifolium medium]|nr:hypothetical protein [Trifolium medium]